MFLKIVVWAARLLGIWTMYNGAGHTIAVLLEKRPYDRHLVYLLMVGGILFFSGFIEFISSWGLKTKQWRAYAVCFAGCVFVISMTLALLPIFKAVGMLSVQSVLFILVLASLFVKKETPANYN